MFVRGENARSGWKDNPQIQRLIVPTVYYCRKSMMASTLSFLYTGRCHFVEENVGGAVKLRFLRTDDTEETNKTTQYQKTSIL